MSENSMFFSLLMAVCKKDDPTFLFEALKSIANNSLQPTEVILVEDGPITRELRKVINGWSNVLNIKSIGLERNSGLGAALNEVLKHCKYEVIVRADADDINRPNRFQCQLNYLLQNPDIDILSSWVEEFSVIPGDKTKVRKVPPQQSLDIFSKKRCPFNHPAVCFRKKTILSLGGYGNEHLYEDYSLWMKMLNSGCKGDNIQEILVDMRFSDEALKRRGGIKYALSELRTQWNFYVLNYISLPRFVSNAICRTSVRIIPNKIRVSLYKIFLRS